MGQKVRLGSVVGGVVVLVCIGLAWGWGCLALYYAGPQALLFRQILIALFVLSLLLCFGLSRSFSWGVLTAAFLFGGLLIWWSTLTPVNDKEWLADVAQLPQGSYQGEVLTLHNVRNFHYYSEENYQPQWETRQYDLAKLSHLDLFVSYWGSPYIAHTILSWGFSDGQQLAVSVETRKSKGQVYSAVQGFFKQYNLTYVAADERDLVGLRAQHRGEEVYFYRLQNVSVEDSRALLDSYVSHMNELAQQQEFYNALTSNCTTTILLNIKALDPTRIPFDWRLLVNGLLDQYLYDLKSIRTDIPFGELRQKSRIDRRLEQYRGEDFSGYLRQGLI